MRCVSSRLIAAGAIGQCGASRSIQARPFGNPGGPRCAAGGEGGAGGSPPSATSAPPRPLDYRVALITGGNTGIGFETAKALAKQNYRVVLACRDRAKAEAARAKLQ